MIRKYATATIIGHELIPADADGKRLHKAAHRVVFDYVPRPGYLYVRSRMISDYRRFFSMYRFCAAFRQARQWRMPPRSYVFSGVNS